MTEGAAEECNECNGIGTKTYLSLRVIPAHFTPPRFLFSDAHISQKHQRHEDHAGSVSAVREPLPQVQH
jgi:hypothetical protein